MNIVGNWVNRLVKNRVLQSAVVAEKNDTPVVRRPPSFIVTGGHCNILTQHRSLTSVNASNGV
jgi:hypothetical protein